MSGSERCHGIGEQCEERTSFPASRFVQKPEREDAPLGIILCAGKKQEQIELLELSASGIHVAEYLTALPPKDILRRRLHVAMKASRQRLENPEAGA